MAEWFVVINRKVSADKQKDQVPDGTPNCKLNPKPIFTIYCLLFGPSAVLKKILRGRKLGISFLKEVLTRVCKEDLSGEAEFGILTLYINM